jgi:hypothetical protein
MIGLDEFWAMSLRASQHCRRCRGAHAIPTMLAIGGLNER